MQQWRVLILIVLFTSGLSVANAFDFLHSTDNAESCIIHKLQDVHNKPAATTVIRACRQTYQSAIITQPSYPLGLMENWQECLTKYGSRTKSEYVAKAIRNACYKLNTRKDRPSGLFDDLLK